MGNLAAGGFAGAKVIGAHTYRVLWQTGWEDSRIDSNRQCKQQKRVQLEKNAPKMLRKQLQKNLKMRKT